MGVTTTENRSIQSARREPLKEGSPGTSSTEQVFLQKRIALLSLILSLLGVLGFVGSYFSGPNPMQLFPWFIASATSTSLWVALWLACRGRPRSSTFCRSGEAVSFLCMGVALAAMSRLLGPDDLIPGLDPFSWGGDSGGHFWGLTRLYWTLAHVYGLALYCMLRAALVPSSSWRTFVLTTLAGVPLLVMAAMPSSPFDPPELAGSVVPRAYWAVGAVNFTMQWAFTVAVCTVMSKIIFGLRRELKELRQLGQYTLEAKIGEGGMGTVYRARHAMMRRPTAIKLLSSNANSNERHRRFEREVQETARLTHPNTITIFDYGRTPSGVFYYVMELLDGATVEAVVELAGPMPAERVVHVLTGLCGSLAEAHGVGLIHRDVKPANIFLCSQGGRPDVPKLLDFGLVKELGQAPATDLTDALTVTGTPLYMAPEMITSPNTIDERADIYALGAVGYFLLTGTHVFSGTTAVEVCSHHLHTKPEAPSKRLGSAVHEELAAILIRCLAKQPEDRPASAVALADLLGTCIGERAWTVQDAEQWWGAHGATLASKHLESEGSTGSRTMAVDLNR